MDSETLIAALTHLSLDELRAVDSALHDRIAAVEVASAVPLVVAERGVRSVTYRQEYVRCGKPLHRCVSDACHGPYSYAYSFAGGKTRKRYIGKQFRTIERGPVDRA